MSRSVHHRHHSLVRLAIYICAVVVTGGILRVIIGKSIDRNIVDTQKNPIITDGSFEAHERRAWFLNEPVSPLGMPLAQVQKPVPVLGETTDEKWIDIDLSTQTLRAMEGDRVIYEFKISSGKWAPTPVGEYRIWIKLRYTKMSGGSKEKHTYYYLPNVPYVMYFYQGYGIHGAYWHNNFGQPMSHGCVNMAIPDAEKMYEWADPVMPEGKSVVHATSENPGTRVMVHGVAPKT